MEWPGQVLFPDWPFQDLDLDGETVGQYKAIPGQNLTFV